MNTKAIFKKVNFNILYMILSKEEGIIYTVSIINPKDSVFEKPYSKSPKTN